MPADARTLLRRNASVDRASRLRNVDDRDRRRVLDVSLGSACAEGHGQEAQTGDKDARQDRHETLRPSRAAGH